MQPFLNFGIFANICTWGSDLGGEGQVHLGDKLQTVGGTIYVTEPCHVVGEFIVSCICVLNQQRLQSAPLQQASDTVLLTMHVRSYHCGKIEKAPDGVAWPRVIVQLLFKLPNHDRKTLWGACISMCRSECNMACKRFNQCPFFVGWEHPSPPMSVFSPKACQGITAYVHISEGI